MKTKQELEADLEAAEAEVASIQERIVALRNRHVELNVELAKVVQELREVDGGFGGRGLMGAALSKRQEAQQRLEDSDKTLIRARYKGWGSTGSTGDWKEYVVLTNGPKRAGLRLAGSTTPTTQHLPSNYLEVHPEDVSKVRCLKGKT